MIEIKTHIHKGRIAVYDDKHTLLKSKLYYTSEGMKKTMGEWMKEYFFEGHYITVRPYAECGKVVHRLDIPAPAKIERPPAVYDNGKSLYP